MAKWLKSQEFLTFEVRDKIAYITLNRPEKRNALSPELIRELHEAMLEADDHHRPEGRVALRADHHFDPHRHHRLD